MNRHDRVRRWVFALAPLLAAGGAVGAVGPGCSLELDRSLMNAGGSLRPGDGGTSVAVADAGTMTPPDASVNNGGAVPAATVTCASDSDCAASTVGNACVTAARCDPTYHVCMLDVCDAGACAVASCDLLAKQCAAATPLNFTISVFGVVSGGVGGMAPAYAMAAAYPFLFLLTTNGVMAYDVANPTGNAPSMVTVNGLPFIPDAIVASGRRVYFVSGVQGDGPTYREAIAWIDVPGNPFLPALQASTAFIWTTQSSLADVFVGDQGALELVYASAFEPTANLAPPIGNSTMVVPAPIGALPQNAFVVSSSGPQLVAYRYATNHLPVFALVSGVGQNSGLAGPERTLQTFGPVDDQATFAAGASGAVLWESAPLHAAADGGLDGVASARFTWLAPGGDGGLFDTTAHADLEKYGSAPGIAVGPGSSRGGNAPLVGPTAWFDPNTAVALAATPEDSESTSVQVFDRTSGTVVAGRRGVIPAPPSVLAIAASNGFAYVFAPDDASNRSASVYVVAPACPGGGEEPGDGGPSGDGAASPDGGGTRPHGFTSLAN
jgi:hypothetical protein